MALKSQLKLESRHFKDKDGTPCTVHSDDDSGVWKRVSIANDHQRKNLSNRRLERGILGEGSFGVVSLERRYVEDKPTEMLRAVKEIPSWKLAPDYEQEIETLSKCSVLQCEKSEPSKFVRLSSSFVRILGWWRKDDGPLYIAMEYYTHGDLSQHMDQKRSEKSTRNLMMQLLIGLSVLHGNRTVHRDIKPQNIMINDITQEDGYERLDIKISDFGLCKEFGRSGFHTALGGGIPEYNAPELYGILPGIDPDKDNEDEPEGELEYTFSVDTWSAGALAFRLLTGRFPFRTMGELSIYVQKKEPRQFIANQLRKHCEEVSDDCIDFIQSCLVSDGKRRQHYDAIYHRWLMEELSHNDWQNSLKPRETINDRLILYRIQALFPPQIRQSQ